MEAMPLLPRVAPLVLTALVAASLAGCGDDGPSAAERVCDARSGVRQAVADVAADLRAANLGAARDGVDEVRASLDELTDAVGDLRGEQREELEPLVAQIRADVAALTSVEALGDLGARFDALRTDVEILFGAVAEILDCT